jgi:N-carbamoylputrescine amidase
MKATVCELRNDPAGLEQDWEALVSHVQLHASELVLLPEMAFSPWLAATNQVDARKWAAAVDAHDRWLARVPELAPAVVLGTRPILKQNQRLNEGFIWEPACGYQPVHHKYYLPDEPGFWEATWYERGEGDFSCVQIGALKIGFMICTELWFYQHARAYSKEKVHLVVTPRATPAGTPDKWVAGGRTASVVSGAYSLSSNFSGTAGNPLGWGGTGWIVEPQEGALLGITSQEKPFLTLELDLDLADRAKTSYPRDVKD